MRLAAPGFLLLLFLAVAVLAPGSAQAADTPSARETALALHQSAQPVAQHDDSRVGVQLVVAGIAAGFVVGAGSLAYLLRRKLGLTAYAPDQTAGGGEHH